MARVNVEQKALTDARFAHLGRLVHRQTCACSLTNLDAHRLGLGHMSAVWNECQERETKTLSANDLDVILGVTNASNFLIEVELGTAVKGGRIRIKGTKGRIEWLGKSRKHGAKGAEHGIKGGRPRKTPHGVIEKPPVGFPKKPPPSPSPSIALTKEDKTQTTARDFVEGFVLSAELFAWGTAELKGTHLDVRAQVGPWRDHLRANGYRTKQGPLRDTDASFRTWIRNAVRFENERRKTSGTRRNDSSGAKQAPRDAQGNVIDDGLLVESLDPNPA